MAVLHAAWGRILYYKVKHACCTIDDFALFLLSHLVLLMQLSHYTTFHALVLRIDKVAFALNSLLRRCLVFGHC